MIEIAIFVDSFSRGNLMFQDLSLLSSYALCLLVDSFVDINVRTQ